MVVEVLESSWSKPFHTQIKTGYRKMLRGHSFGVEKTLRRMEERRTMEALTKYPLSHDMCPCTEAKDIYLLAHGPYYLKMRQKGSVESL